MGDSPAEESVIHTRAYLYKVKNKLSQHERRIKYLQDKKEKRHAQTDKNRDLFELFVKKNKENEEMECESSQQEKAFQFKLMLTEWFTDIPDDLEENWLVKFAPEGFRVLLVAKNRHTCFYTTKGSFLFKLKTNFPGGGGCMENGTTVLDCICNNNIHTIFILDCLFWNSMSTLDSEASFRFYWLTSKFQENPELCQYLKYKFVLMDCFPAERSLIQEKMYDVLKINENEVLYNGLVFYHKESHYTFGYTPLTTWLASFMLLEKLGIDIPQDYLKMKPENYINFQHYIENQSFFHQKKRRKDKKKAVELMDV